MIRVSLIFPVYNVSKYVEESLLSALKQTYDNIEYIIIDDCGYDDSMFIVNKIVAKSCKKKDIVIVSHKENRGIGESRNTGIKVATGDYIYFMDSDDQIVFNCIEVLVNLIEEKKVDVVVGSYMIYQNKIVNYRKYCGIYYGIDILLNYFKEKKWDCVCWNILIKTNIIKEKSIYFPKLSYSEDVCFLFKLYTSINSIALSSHITYKYIRRSGSITYKEVDLSKIDNALVSYNIMCQHLELYKQSYLFYILANYLNNFRLFIIRNLFKVDKLEKEYLKRSLNPILKRRDIFHSSFSMKDKLKHSIFLLPYKLKLLVLKLFFRKD